MKDNPGLYEEMHRPIPDSYWVVDGLLLAGEYAGAENSPRARRKLDALLDAGIRAFFDLTEEGELLPYDDILRELASDRRIAVAYDRVPIPDLGVPRPADLQALLSQLKVNVSARTPSYVHCWGGIGRTGTVIGCWLVEQDAIDGNEALTRIADLRRSTPDGRRRSPETDEQCALVLGWKETRRTILVQPPARPGTARTLSNSALFEEMLLAGELPVRRGRLFASQPGPTPRSWDRIEGVLLGLAIGDALGNTSEGQTPVERERAHGEIRDFLPNRHAAHQQGGVPSDDSQLAFWTVEHLVERGNLELDALSHTFASRHIFGIGHAMRAFVSGMKRGEGWRRAAASSAGNGALMRIAPAVLPHLTNPTPALWSDAALLARLTHNDCASVASCVAFVALLWDLGAMDRPPSADWWVERFISVLRDLDRGDAYAPRGGAYPATGPFADLVATRLEEAQRAGWSTRTACDRFYSGAYLLETVPCALYILAQHGADAEEAIVRAVNDTKDNDTIASIVGAAVGMLHGARALPRRWRESLTGRTEADDDGRMFDLIAQAKVRFWAQAAGPAA